MRHHGEEGGGLWQEELTERLISETDRSEELPKLDRATIDICLAE